MRLSPTLRLAVVSLLPLSALGCDGLAGQIIDEQIADGHDFLGDALKSPGPSSRPSFMSALPTELPGGPVPSGLYQRASVRNIEALGEHGLKASIDYAGYLGRNVPSCASAPILSYRVFRATVERDTLSRTALLLVQADKIPADKDPELVRTLFEVWALLPQAVLEDPLLPMVWEVQTDFGFGTIGSACDPRLTSWGGTSSVSFSSYNEWRTTSRLAVSKTESVPGELGVFLHEAVGHAVADNRYQKGPVADEPHLSIYAQSFPERTREVNSERARLLVGALIVDRDVLPDGASQPAYVGRTLLGCGFSGNVTEGLKAFPALAPYFDAPDCSSYRPRNRVVNGFYGPSAPAFPYSQRLDPSGEPMSATCLVNMGGIKPGIGQAPDSARVVAMKIGGSGALNCAAVCPNGMVHDIDGYDGNHDPARTNYDTQACIPVSECFERVLDQRGAADPSRGIPENQSLVRQRWQPWYDLVTDTCSYASANIGPVERCLGRYPDAVVYESTGSFGKEYRCMPRSVCTSPWAPERGLYGYGGRVEGKYCRK